MEDMVKDRLDQLLENAERDTQFICELLFKLAKLQDELEELKTPAE